LNQKTTKSLVEVFNSTGLISDVVKAYNSKSLRVGKGKYRGSKYTLKRGPLIVYDSTTEEVARTAKNLQGVDTCHVDRLNILQLAPGGHLGRLVVFSEGAFKRLNALFGSHDRNSTEKSGYHLNRNLMTCADLNRIINSDQIQSKLRETRTSVRAHDKNKKNPLTNKGMMHKLNPYHKVQVAATQKAEADRAAKRAAAIKAKRSKDGKKARKARTVTYKGLQADLLASYTAAENLIAEEEKAGNYVPGETDEDEE
jgi:large subunit ribosomal protein L4e